MTHSTLRDFKYDPELKTQLDEKVEEDILRQLKYTCDQKTRTRKTYIEHAQYYLNRNSDKSRMYQEKADSVDMTYCDTFKEDKKTIEEYKKKARGG